MNYHIITQDKFFDAYIEDIYNLHQEDNNVFWVRGKKGDMPWLKTKRLVEYLPEEHSLYVEKLRSLKPEDKLFVSWYDLFVGQAIIDSQTKVSLYVLVMGGDLYADPIWYHSKWLYDRRTLMSVREHSDYPKINLHRRPANWWKIYDEYCIRRAFMPVQRQLYAQKLRTMRRVDYVVLPKEAKVEFERIKELYPGCHFQMKYGVYDQNYDKAINFEYSLSLQGRPLNILVGNSADPSNNHLDAFAYVKKKIKRNREIYASLSYGDEQNRDCVIDNGKKTFGDSFHPITEFMDRNAYLEFLSRMDVLIMYHNRQQACGNIMSAITLGKPVFMKKINPVYSMLVNSGVTSVYDVAQIGSINLVETVKLAFDERKKNSDIISIMYSEKTRLNYWRNLL